MAERKNDTDKKHETRTRSGKSRSRKQNGGTEARHGQKTRNRYPKRKSRSRKQNGLRDSAKRSTGQKPRRPKRRAERKNGRIQKTQPPFDRSFMRQASLGVSVGNALLPASDKTCFYGTAGFRSRKPDEYATNIHFLYNFTEKSVTDARRPSLVGGHPAE